MPLITDKKQIASIKESQKTCLLCDEIGGRTERSSAIVCDICSHWVCRECANIEDKLLDFLVQNDLNYSHICKTCKDQIPQIKDLLKISQKQTQIESDIVNMKADIENNKQTLSKYEGMHQRLSNVESIIQNNKLDQEFPVLPAINAATQKMQHEITTQQESTTKMQFNMEEEKRKEAIKMNLIVYGIPEKESTVENQMIADFNVLQELYSDKVQLHADDVTSIVRLGRNTEGKIRPIRVTFNEIQKRREILTNNQGLRMVGDEFKLCKCKANPGKHQHINVTTDKTKQEREFENELREQIKVRRQNGEDVIIRKGKIVNRSLLDTHARWAVIRQNV